MTFKEWEIDHNSKVDTILKKLGNISHEEVTNYFNYDNMIKAEPNFCELYKTNSKCHDMDDLNCFLCGCPFFKYSDETPILIEDGVEVMSICVINSKNAGAYVQDGKQQCDCSGCIIPHKQRFVKKHLEMIDKDITILDSVSTLEWIRGWQLSDIFGKWKLF